MKRRAARRAAAWLAVSALVAFAPAQTATASAPRPRPPGYALVWSDEFSGQGGPDAAQWSHDTGRNREGWRNPELQYYSRDRTENAALRDGRLVITVRKATLSSADDWGRQRYTSARLITRGKADLDAGQPGRLAGRG